MMSAKTPDCSLQLLLKPPLEPTQSIGDIPGHKHNILTKLLNMGQKWQEFAGVAGMNSKYELHDYEISEYGMDRVSPAQRLLTSYSIAGMTCRELVGILNEMQMERALKPLIMPEPLRIVHHPPRIVKALEGDTIELVCHAIGFSYPKYVWFCNDKEVSPEQDSGDLSLSEVLCENSGIYVCRIHNDEVLEKKAQVVFSEPSRVEITSNLSTRSRIIASQQSGQVPHSDSYRPPPIITIQPRYQLQVKFLDHVTLSCSATSETGDPLSFDWFKNNQPLIGQHLQVLDIWEVHKEDEGMYHCQVSQARGGIVCSSQSYITVITNQLIPLVPEILRHPTGGEVDLRANASFSFSVKACGQQPLHYEWYQNGTLIKGHQGPELKIQCIGKENEGTYQVRVVNCNHVGVLSKEAVLVVKQQRDYTAEDKVALLIGNSKSHKQRLPAVENDICETKEALTSMGFMVIALLDLTKDEMKIAVDIFCELVNEGVYALFYFAGHGFIHEGKHYCMSWDAGQLEELKYSVSVEEIERTVQAKNPALLFMLLDMCRRSMPEPNLNQGHGHGDCDENKEVSPMVNGNTCTWFATSTGQGAYEYIDNHGPSPFCKRLLEVLKLNLPLIQLYPVFREEFNKEKTLEKHQDPEMRTNLKETGRSLTDPIESQNVREKDTRLQLWEKIHDHSRKVYRLGFGMNRQSHQLEVTLYPWMSNVLQVIVKKKNVSTNYNVKLSCDKKKEPGIEIEPLTRSDNGRLSYDVAWYRIRSLQQLQTCLELHMEFSIRGSENAMKTFSFSFGKPLISSLKHWEEQRQPDDESECETGEQSDDSSTYLKTTTSVNSS